MVRVLVIGFAAACMGACLGACGSGANNDAMQGLGPCLGAPCAAPSGSAIVDAGLLDAHWRVGDRWSVLWFASYGDPTISGHLPLHERELPASAAPFARLRLAPPYVLDFEVVQTLAGGSGLLADRVRLDIRARRAPIGPSQSAGDVLAYRRIELDGRLQLTSDTGDIWGDGEAGAPSEGASDFAGNTRAFAGWLGGALAPHLPDLAGGAEFRLGRDLTFPSAIRPWVEAVQPDIGELTFHSFAVSGSPGGHALWRPGDLWPFYVRSHLGEGVLLSSHRGTNGEVAP